MQNGKAEVSLKQSEDILGVCEVSSDKGPLTWCRFAEFTEDLDFRNYDEAEFLSITPTRDLALLGVSFVMPQRGDPALKASFHIKRPGGDFRNIVEFTNFYPNSQFVDGMFVNMYFKEPEVLEKGQKYGIAAKLKEARGGYDSYSRNGRGTQEDPKNKHKGLFIIEDYSGSSSHSTYAN